MSCISSFVDGLMELLRRQLPYIVMTVALPVLSSIATAQTDRRSVHLLVGFAAGSSVDIVARLLAEQMNKAQGLTMIVQNLPGAGTLIATEAAARADPNGNTLLITSPPFVINTHLRKVNYDPLTSFEPICDLLHTPTFIVVDNTSPYQTLADLLDAARAQPAAFSLASIGPATTTHIAFELLKRAANVNMTFVPYPGNVPAVNALLGEHVTSVFADYAAVVELLKAGKLRALAVSSRTRMEQLPDVPTFVESGYKDVDADIWFGVIAPANTKDTLSQCAGWFTAALRVPQVKAKFAALGLLPVGTCGADFGAYLRKQYEEYGRLIRELNIKGG
jgi:tripartite-type tricarboxylate transporter receptor subunit TctC